MSAGITAILGALIGDSILEALIEGLLKDSARGGSTVAKVETAIETGYMSNITKNVFTSLTNKEPNANVGLTDQALYDIIDEVVKATAYASVVLPAEVVEELFMELIQEGFSNAIQMSVGGAFQSILNVWRGGFPLNPDEIEALAENADKVDVNLLGLLMAMGGCNIPTTSFRVARGFEQYVEKEYVMTREQAHRAVESINRALGLPFELVDNIITAEIHDLISLVKECWIKAQNTIERSAERALSRLNELKVELETVQKWIELQEANPDYDIIDADTAYLTAIENEAEADATKSSYDTLKSNVESTLSNISIDVSSLLSEFDNLLSKQVEHYNNIIYKCYIDLSSIKDRLINALKMVQAYRNAVDGSSSIASSVEEVYQGGGTQEPPPIVQGSYLLVVTQTVSRLSAPSYNSLVTATQTITRLSAPSYNSLLVVVS